SLRGESVPSLPHDLERREIRGRDRRRRLLLPPREPPDVGAEEMAERWQHGFGAFRQTLDQLTRAELRGLGQQATVRPDAVVVEGRDHLFHGALLCSRGWLRRRASSVAPSQERKPEIPCGGRRNAEMKCFGERR